MPGKHTVHWDRSPVSAYLPPTPSTSYSITTASSSSPCTPRTPPALGSGSPHETTPLPNVGPSAIAPLLCYSQTSELATYGFDVLYHPSYIIPKLPRGILECPATSPQLPRLTIVSPHKSFPWRLNISASSHHYVTIADVLNGLYIALRTQATQQEYAYAKPDQQKEISKAFLQRCRRVGGDKRAYETEHAKGLKRVDFLITKTRWQGLVHSTDSTEPGTFILYTS